MDGINNFDPNLFLNPAIHSAASAQTAKTKKNEQTSKTKRKTFSSAFEQAQAEQEVKNLGLPIEIASMTEEEAVIFLKDAADIAADKLRKSQMPDVYADYRLKVSQFLRYIVKNNFEIKKKRSNILTRKGLPMQPKVQVKVINEKLDEISRWMLSTHKDTLNMLAKIDEIQGLLVDLMAL